MNILYISPNFNYSCGVSYHVFQILRYYETETNYNIHFITNGGNALDRLKQLKKVKVEYYKFTTGILNLFYSFFFLKRLREYCKKHSIQIIHTHHRYPELMSYLIARKLKTKTITTVHSFVKGFAFFSFKSDKIIAVSDAVKKFVIHNYPIPQNKVRVLYNCVSHDVRYDREKLEMLRMKLNIKNTEYVIIYLGRLNKIKGIDLLIKAFRKIKLKYSNVKLIFVGTILDDTYRKMNVRPDEDILHLEARTDVTLFFQLCDTVILPSRKDPFPYVMLEAGVFKKTFIGSRTGGIAEFIEDGVEGFLFDPGDENDLADKITFVINNPGKAESAAKKLEDKVIKKCNCEEYYEKLTNSYKELLADK